MRIIIYYYYPPPDLYNRTAPYAYLGSFEVGEVGTVDGVSITDGVAAINYPLNEDFPRGLLVAQDNDNISKKKRKPKRQNFKLISFADVIDALKLKWHSVAAPSAGVASRIYLQNFSWLSCDWADKEPGKVIPSQER